MRRHGGGKLMWGITVVALLGFVEQIGAIPLESWDTKIPNVGTRFKVLSEFNGEAVLDKETQLVWQLSPNAATFPWPTTRDLCADGATGGRKGWRLPSLPELTSLVDPSVFTRGVPSLPPGHPFLNVQFALYWSATTDAVAPGNAWVVGFHLGGIRGVGSASKADSLNFWCVRGGMNADQY